MPTDEQWIGAMSASAEDQNKTLKEGAAEFHRLLEAGRIAFDLIDEILSVRLQNIDEETWSTVQECLRNYLGVDGEYLVGWLMQFPNTVEDLEEFAPPDVASFLRQVLALHGPELANAFARWKEFPDNWRGMNREVFLDQITGLYRIQLRIAKFNGDTVMFEGPPDSFLKMARNILITLQGLAPDYYNEAVLGEFVKDAGAFLESISAGLEGLPTDAGNKLGQVEAPEPEPSR